MKKSLLSVSMAALLASTSVTAWASSVIIPNSFTAGSKAVAADVNANFDVVATSVNDNDARVTTNAGDIGTNGTAITANAGVIGTNGTAITANAGVIGTNGTTITANAGDIGTNAGDIGTNGAAITAQDGRITTNEGVVAANGITLASDHETRIAANETAISGATSCPAGEMVAVGPLCVDIYEASVWTGATTGTQIVGTPICSANGNDCAENPANLNPIYARSVAGVTPNVEISWYQAAQACANVGKRLPTTAEWTMAASGTPLGPPLGTDPTLECNTSTVSAAVVSTGASSGSPTACVSSTGVFDMAGNLWEWSADLAGLTVSGGFTFTTTDAVGGVILGGSFNSGNSETSADLATVGAGPDLVTNTEIGFRCVR